MIKRKALLIGAPGGINTTFLPGVSADLSNMRKFLMSPQGGAWYNDEIIILNDPQSIKLNKISEVMDADYTITLFSGHGFADYNKNRFLSLTGGSFFQDLELLNNSPRQLVLIDACRNVISIGISGLPEEEEWSHFDGGEADLVRARKMYDRWIELSPYGKVIIHSTNHNTSASDTENGGIFTQKLLHVGYRVPIKEKFNFYNIVSTGNVVSDMIREDGHEQRPTIAYKQGNIKLPFALSLPRTKFISKAIQTEQKPNYAGILFGLSLIGLAVAAFKD